MEAERDAAVLGAAEIDELRSLIDAVAGAPGAGVPLSAALLLFSRLDPDRRRALFAVPEGRVLVQEHLLVETHRRLRADEPLGTATRLFEPASEGAPCRLEVDLFDAAGEPVAELRTALRAVPSAGLAASHGLPLSRAAPTPDVVRHPTGPLDATLVGRWVRLVGDDNPVHVDADFARSLGLAGAVVPGALLAAAAEAFLGPVVDTGRMKLNIRFTGPMPIGRETVVEVREKTAADGGGRRQFRLFFAADERIAAVADVSAG